MIESLPLTRPVMLGVMPLTFVAMNQKATLNRKLPMLRYIREVGL